jgi:enoyl-[acyl-carrier-protein] reductase (NADH)
MGTRPLQDQWALILGASSGFGAAIARTLASEGCHIAGVHLDRKATLPQVHALIGEIEAAERRALFFNVNASSQDKRQEVIAEMGRNGVTSVKVLVHSLAFGSLLPYFPPEGDGNAMRRDRMEMTLDVMAHSLVYWSQDLYKAGLLQSGARIFAMTSSGSTRVIESYGAVSAAKAALESHIRQIAAELGRHGIAANALRAGVTDTPALRQIPGNEQLLAEAAKRNPGRRLTTPEDVAGAVLALSSSGAGWISGNVIGVDGGEDIVG